MPTEYMTALSARFAAKAAIAKQAKTAERRALLDSMGFHGDTRDYRSALLIRDGRKAIKQLQAGRSPQDILLTMGCSRARLYRAIARAHAFDAGTETRDPLLE